MCWAMAADRAARLCPDVDREPAYAALRVVHDLGIRSYVGVPLELSTGERIGSLCLNSTRPGRFNEFHLRALGVLGRLLGYEFERELLATEELPRFEGLTEDATA
jgi:GAF domain-containing protein